MRRLETSSGRPVAFLVNRVKAVALRAEIIIAGNRSLFTLAICGLVLHHEGSSLYHILVDLVNSCALHACMHA